MSDIKKMLSGADTSISGQSAALFVTEDESLAALILHHDIKVRDFILLSFLSDQGPMSILRLAGVIGIDPQEVTLSVKRLTGKGLLLRDPIDTNAATDEMVTLTGRGQDIASRICNQID
jgi:DNA-binding MarR family transcriptional regulator